MSLTRVNATAATLTKNRTEGSISPLSGMCVTCVDGCIGMCEIGKSAYRGTEVIYPQPFGITTSASEKNYPIDLSHFNILGTAVGAQGIEANSNIAIFPNADLEVRIGKEKDIKLRLPFIIPGLGSTAVAKNNWDGLAIGASMAGVPLTIGENVCGMDPQSTIEDGRVVDSPDLASRVRMYRDWQIDGYGDIIVQANVEDTALGVQEYALEKLGVKTVELKWGQGAKNIGGEVKLNSLERAKLLKSRGYVVLPDPADPDVAEAYRAGSFHEFERHSRVGMVTEKGFMDRVEELRDAGAKHVFLKTGAYRPADLARAVKYASKAELDLLTVDGAGGGTGMSPWRMMNEWGIPQVEIYSLLYRYLKRLDERGEFVPDVAVAGGITMEDHVYKALALGAPYFKIAGMARSPLAAAMVGKTIGRRINEGKVPVYISRFGSTVEEIFITTPHLKKIYNSRFAEIPPGAIGVYTYFQRLRQGMQQLMTGNRKFALKYIERGDIAAITREAASVSGIPYIMDVDQEEVERILS
ncbi:glutamate synthase family protein [Candidatus Methanoperedens nitroreducens]|uniref:Glutamate synthase family protein n=1 Tax=Candidatus Methanoperedens nitratireducens TaxID=1392998 RepID=A0A062V859_9EURY|nr:FMN-binding glutamate synthase family protein [Candidatus Methanoperedens nitroreducens]KCZ71570.1 glutamate synthase family protein [Candidatus Methanoperedens nitroreducens]MDJ1421198.1 FMN-binding glutamate synthase family protein [Candidatus Methanoperedens sp.]